MLKNTTLFVVILSPMLALSCNAEIAAIRSDTLPQEAPVLHAIADAHELEPYSASFATAWHFPVSKDEVAKRLASDLEVLKDSVEHNPDNLELLLVTSLVAHYAYNVDVPNSIATSFNLLDRAHALSPSDVRSSWFEASLLCQTNRNEAGAKLFLSIESDHPWTDLAVGFWNDYIECAYISSLPEHLLRAADHMEQMHAAPWNVSSFALEATRKAVVAFDPARTYDPHEVWRAANLEDATEFTSTACDVKFRTQSGWSVDQIGVTKGSCVAYFSSGPYHGAKKSLRPSIALAVNQPLPGQTLQDYAQMVTKDHPLELSSGLPCPAKNCIEMKGVQPGMYGKDGDGHGRIVFFERGEPEYPGLLFEKPIDVAKSAGKKDSVVLRPEPNVQRIPGTLFYMVILDTAASIEDPALNDFKFFLDHLAVE